MESDGTCKRNVIVERFNIVVVASIVAVLSISIVFAYIIGAQTDVSTIDITQVNGNSAAPSAGLSVVSFFIVFLCYGFVAILLVAFLFYRAFSPFNRLIDDMQHILAGDYKRRLFLRQKDISLLKCFIENVNELVEKVDKIHDGNKDLIVQIDKEAEAIFQLMDSGSAESNEAKEAFAKFHKNVKNMVEQQKQDQ